MTQADNRDRNKSAEDSYAYVTIIVTRKNSSGNFEYFQSEDRVRRDVPLTIKDAPAGSYQVFVRVNWMRNTQIKKVSVSAYSDVLVSFENSA